MHYNKTTDRCAIIVTHLQKGMHVWAKRSNNDTTLNENSQYVIANVVAYNDSGSNQNLVTPNKVKDPETGKIVRPKAILPEEWNGSFGMTVEEHEASTKIDLSQGFMGMGDLVGADNSIAPEDSAAQEDNTAQQDGMTQPNGAVQEEAQYE